MKSIINFNWLIVFVSTLFVIESKAQNQVLYTTLNDAASITGASGTQNGGSFAAGQYGNGFLIDSNGENASFEIGETTDGTTLNKVNQNKGTIAFWYKPNYASTTETDAYFFSSGNSSATQIRAQYYTSGVDPNQIRFIIGNAGLFAFTSSASWSADDLIHLAFVWDASGGNADIDGGKSAAIYVNGTISSSDNDTWTPVASTSTFLIGENSQGSGASLFNGEGVFDDFYVYDDVLTSTQINNLKDSQVLPVELTSFSANLFKNSVNLNWATATEINNYGFEIERRKTQDVRNETWEKIGFVNGHGNSNSPKFYSFVDNNAPIGELQYRLKQIDFDGAFEYSDVVTIINSQNYKFDLAQNYPNPFNPTTTISFTVPNVVDANFASTTLKVYDVLGSEIAVLFNEKKSPGNYKVDFDASILSTGMYFYTLTSGSFRQTKKMLLIK